ncbi:MAG: hypothetical protein ACFFAN_06050 [Promethearchaeota archaeon]
MSSDLKSKIDPGVLLEKYKGRTQTLKLLNDLTRLRLILLLIVFRKLSLTEISSYLGRVKSTTTHHLKKFKDFLKITKKQGRGTINSNIYELVPNFLEKLSVNFEDLKHIPKEKNKNLFHYVIQNDIKFLELVKRIFDLVRYFYEKINESSSNDKTESLNKAQRLYLENLVKYNAWFLTEKGKKSYEELIKKFNYQMQEIIDQDEKNKEKKARTYLVLNAFIPLEKVVKFDPTAVFNVFNLLKDL